MNESKDDHYVSRTYLKHFHNNNKKLWIYSKRFLSLNERSRKSVCSKQGWSDNPFYSNSRLIEDYLRILENNWNRAIELISRERAPSRKEWQEIKSTIAGYLSYLKFYPPAAVRVGNSMLENAVKARAAAMRDSGKLSAPKGYEYLLDDIENQIKVEVDPKYSHAVALRSISKIANSFFEMPWHLLYNETSIPFITSDNPACNWFERNCMIGTYLPVSPRVAILVKPTSRHPSSKFESDQPVDVNEAFVRKMNALVTKSANDIVISNIKSTSILEIVREFQNWQFASIPIEFPTPKGKIILSKWAPTKKT